MKKIKLISYILSVVMLAFTLCFSMVAFAADDEEAVFSIKDYTSIPYTEPKFKIKYMGILTNPEEEDINKHVRIPHFSNDKFELWAEEDTGEVAIVDKTTGQIIFTNPYDVAACSANSSVKQQLLSQIILQYKDNTGATVEFNSYKDAALNGKVIDGISVNQISVTLTRNGIRVNYTLGKEQAQYLVPKQIEKESFEKNILEPWIDKDSRAYRQLIACYTLKDPFDPKLSETALSSMQSQFPATENYAIYTLAADITNKELQTLAAAITQNTDYDEDMMAEDYDLIEYVDTAAAPAIFRMAIEYELDEYGVKISVPASSITYDASSYTVTSIKILPYLGAGRISNTGVTLLADGSGTVTRFEDVTNAFTISSKVYGKDYTYHSLSGYNQETMRIPAMGIIENVAMSLEKGQTEEDRRYCGNGFVAYYEEGASLIELSASHGGTTVGYNSVYATCYPKDSDTYALTGISSTGDASWTIDNARKYTGNYSMRLLPVYGEGADYNTMAKVLREYLEETGVITRLDKADEKNENVALYIENFGTVKTDEKVLGFPTKVQTPLTTFEQTEGIIKDLNKRGVDNINIRLTGWYNGGLVHKAPSTLNVPSAIGGMDDLEDLAKFAEKNGVGLYPDLDYTYVEVFGMFDGISKKDDTAETMDGRKAVHRNYSALYQGFEADEKSIISAGSMRDLYDKIKEKFEGIGASGISVATLGSDLNSNFNEDFPVNREESKSLLEDFLAYLKKRNGSVMIDGGNDYTWKYADHILNVPLESSMNINTSLSVPFVGMLLHGYTEFAGTPINLDGDYDASILKAIENGANLYFLVSKENTSELKAFPEFSKYYAISYDNWANDIEETYKKFNEVMKGVKYSLIEEHEQIGTRLVRVKYDNGTEFVLNYNTHEVTLENGTTVGAMSFIVK